MYFTDTGIITKRERTSEGFLKVNAKLAKPGVQLYYLFELPSASVPSSVSAKLGSTDRIRILRPDSEVFDDSSVSSFRNKTVTNAHPKQFVDAGNYKDLHVGTVLGEVKAECGVIQGPLLIQDADAIADIEAGREETSPGYSANLDWTSGVDPKYGAYDAVQRDIRVNHVALVDRARAGSEIRLEDGETFDHRPTEKQGENTVKMKINGVSYEFNDQSAEVVAELVKDRDTAQREAGELSAQLTDSQTKVETLEGRLAAAESQANDPKRLHRLAAERAQLIDSARRIDKKFEVKPETTNLEIKRTLATKLVAGLDASEKTEAFLDGVLTGHLARAKAAERDDDGGLADGFKDGETRSAELNDDGGLDIEEAYHERMSNRWKKGGK